MRTGPVCTLSPVYKSSGVCTTAILTVVSRNIYNTWGLGIRSVKHGSRLFVFGVSISVEYRNDNRFRSDTGCNIRYPISNPIFSVSDRVAENSDTDTINICETDYGTGSRLDVNSDYLRRVCS